MLQTLPELLLLRWRQPPELGIVLQHTFLFVGRHIFVTTQPVARVSRALRRSRRLLLTSWLVLRDWASGSGLLVSIFLCHAGRGKGKHRRNNGQCQAFRQIPRMFQVSRLLFPRISFLFVFSLILASRRLLPTRASRICRDFVLHRQLIKQLEIGI
jgi:hypothetical protein